jgi:hypothetical protein
MAKLPDGWIFIPKFKDLTTITVEQKELVCCKNCKQAEQCEIYAGWDGQHPDWFCADGERRDDDA